MKPNSWMKRQPVCLMSGVDHVVLCTSVRYIRLHIRVHCEERSTLQEGLMDRAVSRTPMSPLPTTPTVQHQEPCRACIISYQFQAINTDYVNGLGSAANTDTLSELGVQQFVCKGMIFVQRPIVRSSPLKRSGMDRTAFTLQTHHTCLYFISIRQVAPSIRYLRQFKIYVLTVVILKCVPR